MLQYLWPESLTGKLLSLFAAAVVFMIVQSLYDMYTTKPALVLTRQPRQIGDITLDSLESYDGRDPGRPILLAIRGRVYDVTEGREYYGPKSSFDAEDELDSSPSRELSQYDVERFRQQSQHLELMWKIQRGQIKCPHCKGTGFRAAWMKPGCPL
ncbi:hypothetical protein WJX74_008869 [Apatococcus lobatus]|uniref:Cytochrome b5 heme-binding domain-containing protein n=1 Tax=Apatococcus lobatus TaxID=904363 RepID=A0AAW1QBG9_9CHLO